jgi:hypothetical protein
VEGELDLHGSAFAGVFLLDTNGVLLGGFFFVLYERRFGGAHVFFFLLAFC